MADLEEYLGISKRAPVPPMLYAPDIPSADDATRAVAAERELDIPAGVGVNLPELETLLNEGRARAALKSSTVLFEWLNDPVNAGLGRDDLENLSTVEKIGNHLAKGAVNLGAGVMYRLKGRNLDLAQFAGKTQAEIRAIILPPEARDALAKSGQHAAIARYMQDAAEVFHAIDGIRPEEFEERADDHAKTISGMEKYAGDLKGFESAERFQKSLEPAMKADTLADQSLGFLQAVADDPGGAWVFLNTVVLESAAPLAGAALTAAVTRSPTAAAGVMGFGSGLAEYSAKVSEELRGMGVDISTDEGRRLLLNSPEIMREAEAKGIAKGAVIGIIGMAGMGVASKALLSGPLKNLAAQAVVQMVIDGGGEALGEIAAGGEVNAIDIILEAGAGLVTAPADVAIMAGGRAFRSDSARAARSGKTKAQLELADEAAAASKLRERSTAKWQDLLSRMDWANVLLSVPSDDLNTFFQAKDLGPEDFGIDPATYEDALASGSDVAIPGETYMDRIASTEDAAWFHDHATFDPAEMSVAEAQRFNASVQEIIEAEQEKAEAEARVDEMYRPGEIQVRDEIFRQLRAAGRSPDVAEREASVWQAWFRTMGERYGEDPLDLARQFGVQIKGPESDPSRIRSNLDIALNTLRRRKGNAKTRAQSLMQFLIAKGGLQDPGGDVAVLDGPETLVAESADAMRQAGMLPGGRKGMGLDEAARAAVEDGFFPDMTAKLEDPNAVEADLVPMLLEALRREMAGEMVVRPDDEVTDDLAELSEALDEAGLSLDMTNDEIAEAIGQAESAGEGTLFQDAFELEGWEDVKVAAELDDGSTKEMTAGEVKANLDARVTDARTLLECLNG